MQMPEPAQATQVLAWWGKKYGDSHAKPCTLWMHGFFREK